MSTELAALAADPSRVADVAPEKVPPLLGELELLRAMLWARNQPLPAPQPPATNGSGPDTLLKVDEAAARLGVSRRWMYAHADTLPFAKRLTGGTLRFSSRGLERWQANR
jgi:predicted DNA-binding transcriptional regulator AlpA